MGGQKIATIAVKGGGLSVRVRDPLGRSWDWDGKRVANRLPGCVAVAVNDTARSGGSRARPDEWPIYTMLELHKLVPGEYSIRVKARQAELAYVSVYVSGEDLLRRQLDYVDLRRGAVGTWVATWACDERADTCSMALRRIRMPASKDSAAGR
jgi:hypothetical protein